MRHWGVDTVPARAEPPRRALYVPVEVVAESAGRSGFIVVAPGDQRYDELYDRCTQAFRTFGIPMPYADER